MDTEGFMLKHHLTDAMLDEMAAPFERGDYELSHGTIRLGSHLVAAGGKTVNAAHLAGSETAGPPPGSPESHPD